MKIRKPLRFILLGACLIQSLAMAADTQPTNADNRPNAEISVVSKDDLSAQKELFQLQLDAKKELLQKDIEGQSKRIDAFEKRIDDQTSRISDISASVDRFGILITLLFFVAGLLGYRAAKNDAREAAKEAAEQSAAKWFEDNHKNLLSRMEELEARAIKASQTIDTHEAQVVEISNAAHAEIEASKEKIKADEKKVNEQMEIFQRQLSQSVTIGKYENQSPKDNSAIEQKAEQLKQKPETEYTFTDWNTRAFAAYSEGKLDDAIFYWDKAIASDASLQDQAQTMINKGFALGKLNRNEEAIAVYGLVINNFDTSEMRLRELVALALIGKAFSLLCIAKANWENIALAKEQLVHANNACTLATSKISDNGLAYGNLAYITWLQDDALAAEQHFRTGLTSTTFGGEELYKATLTDFDIHPIEPDQGFRELVEKLWAEYKQSKKVES
jgi:tetratricopeptide (TPR) repeat protein